MSSKQRGVILYGRDVEAVATALSELDPQYVLVDGAAPGAGQVPVLRYRRGTEADAARDAAPGIAWLVVELFESDDAMEHARDVGLWLNTVHIDPRAAALAIDQPDLVTWYEVFNPIQVGIIDGRPVADDYSNFKGIVPKEKSNGGARGPGGWDTAGVPVT